MRNVIILVKSLLFRNKIDYDCNIVYGDAETIVLGVDDI